MARSPRRRARPRRTLYGSLLQLWQTLNPPEWLEGVICWWLNPRYLIGVTGLIWDEHGQLLLVRQTYTPAPGWGLPGGWLGAGERLEDGVRRELREELSYEVAVGPLLGWAELWPPRHYTFAFECTVLGGQFTPNAEISELGYFTPADVLRLVRPRLLPLLKPILAQRVADAASPAR